MLKLVKSNIRKLCFCSCQVDLNKGFHSWDSKLGTSLDRVAQLAACPAASKCYQNFLLKVRMHFFFRFFWFPQLITGWGLRTEDWGVGLVEDWGLKIGDYKIEDWGLRIEDSFTRSGCEAVLRKNTRLTILTFLFYKEKLQQPSKDLKLIILTFTFYKGKVQQSYKALQ